MIGLYLGYVGLYTVILGLCMGYIRVLAIMENQMAKKMANVQGLGNSQLNSEHFSKHRFCEVSGHKP